MSTTDLGSSTLVLEELINLKFDEVYNAMIEWEKKMGTEMEKLVRESDSLKKKAMAMASVEITQASNNADGGEQQTKIVEMEEEIHKLRLQILQLEEKLHTSEAKYREQLQRLNDEAMDNSAEEEEKTATDSDEMLSNREADGSGIVKDSEGQDEANIKDKKLNRYARIHKSGKTQASSSAARILIVLSDSDHEPSPVDTTHVPDTLSRQASKRNRTEREDNSHKEPGSNQVPARDNKGKRPAVAVHGCSKIRDDLRVSSKKRSKRSAPSPAAAAAVDSFDEAYLKYFAAIEKEQQEMDD